MKGENMNKGENKYHKFSIAPKIKPPNEKYRDFFYLPFPNQKLILNLYLFTENTNCLLSNNFIQCNLKPRFQLVSLKSYFLKLVSF